MSRSLYNDLVSRQANITTKMRHWWNKTFFVIIRAMVFLNQLILMAPFLYYKKKRTAATTTKISAKWHFRTHRVVTGMAIFFCLFLCASAPFLVKIATDMYGNTRKRQDNLFKIIAEFTMTTDVLCSLLIMAAQIWHRAQIVEVLNLFIDITAKMQTFERDIVSFKIFVALLLKMGLTIYELVLSVPFIVTASSRLSTANILGFVANLFLQHLSSIYSMTLFTFILLILTLSQQLERQLRLFENISSNKKMTQLIYLQNALQRLIDLFVATTQFCIFLVILLNFVTILCNIYALLDYYVTTKRMYRTFITYILGIALDLYSLILVTYLCDRSQKRVRDLFLIREEQYFFKLPPVLDIVETSVLWPQHEEIYILGLFCLNNDFALFLLAYSINFIMIILEFEINKARN